MSTKVVFASFVGLGITLGIASTSHARTELGVEAQVLPIGEAEGDNATVDFGTSFGIVGLLDYALGRNVSIGAAPRLILGIEGDDEFDAGDSSTQLDLSARLTVHGRVAPKVDLFGYVAPGYSFLFLPDAVNERGPGDPSGLILGVGGGAGFKVGRNLSLIGDIGYTFGFQTADADGESIDFATSYLHLGIGLKGAI